MQRKMRITIECYVSAEANQERLVQMIESSLQPMLSKTVVTHIPIKTVGPRVPPVGGGSAYDSRLWEKTTCRIADRPTDDLPPDVLANPEIKVEFIEV